jgi:hypothetical protein
MKLRDQSVVCVRKNIENWDYFDNQSGIKMLPKREMYNQIPAGNIGHSFDNSVIPTLRNSESYESAAQWATHTAIIQLFLDNSKADWLCVIEGHVELSQYDIEKIEADIRPGLTLLSEKFGAYIVDRKSAEVLTKNLLVYYAPLEQMFRDLGELQLLELTESKLLKNMDTRYNLFLDFLPLILTIFLCILLFILFYPPDSLFGTKNAISLAKMFTAKESSIG